MSGLLLSSYFAMPVWAQNLILSTYGLRLRYLRYGRYHAEVLKQLLVSQWLPADGLRELQLASLNALLKHAVANVPFYRSQGFPESASRLGDLSQLPILRKSDVRRAGRVLVASTSASRSLTQIHTGGTTGMPLTIFCDRATLQRNYAFFARLRTWAQVPPKGRVVTFAGRTFVSPDQPGPPYWRSNLAANTLLMSSYFLSPRTIDAYIERIRSFRPDLIDSYPSAVEVVARRVARSGMHDIRPRAVITSSETLSPAVRDLIRAAFACPVFDQYGGAEMAAFVSQCEKGSYHVNPEFGIVEILRDGQPVQPGEEGEIVATGFINPVMPLIRYATGDSAVQGAVSCSCGRAFPTVERIEGRVEDVLVTPEGRRVGRLDPIFKSVSSIQEARIVQDASDHVRLEVVPDVGFGPQEAAMLVAELARLLGPSMRIDLVRVASIPRAPSGASRTTASRARRRRGSGTSAGTPRRSGWAAWTSRTTT